MKLSRSWSPPGSQQISPDYRYCCCRGHGSPGHFGCSASACSFIGGARAFAVQNCLLQVDNITTEEISITKTAYSNTTYLPIYRSSHLFSRTLFCNNLCLLTDSPKNSAASIDCRDIDCWDIDCGEHLGILRNTDARPSYSAFRCGSPSLTYLIGFIVWSVIQTEPQQLILLPKRTLTALAQHECDKYKDRFTRKHKHMNPLPKARHWRVCCVGCSGIPVPHTAIYSALRKHTPRSGVRICLVKVFHLFDWQFESLTRWSRKTLRENNP